ncbi:MAG: hypothetical protein NPIRA04_01290 [Nitrospirales bacterium]|nr:MAG: hypothetical protein NPIRA04_01290 [Nitrospirales bacterium]
MAQKFGNFRWVKEGYLDNRTDGLVVGQMLFAGLGLVDFCLAGQCTGEIRGQAFRFRNSKFLDDARAMDSLADMDNPQIGKVSLISFDPHPLLPPHPYIEWFSQHEDHYRLELEPDDAHILSVDDCSDIEEISQSIRSRLHPQIR